MTCSTWRTSSRELKSHQDGYGPTMTQLSNMVEFKTLEEENRTESPDLVQESRRGGGVGGLVAVGISGGTNYSTVERSRVMKPDSDTTERRPRSLLFLGAE